jgi:hypothetical protein
LLTPSCQSAFKQKITTNFDLLQVGVEFYISGGLNSGSKKIKIRNLGLNLVVLKVDKQGGLNSSYSATLPF